GVLLDSEEQKAVYVPEGVAHGFLALEPQSTVMYLCSEGWRPGAEHGVDAFDPHIAVDWPSVALDGTPIEYVMSDKDREAPSLLDAAAAGRLPQREDCVAHVDRLRDSTPSVDAEWRPSDGSNTVGGIAGQLLSTKDKQQQGEHHVSSRPVFRLRQDHLGRLWRAHRRGQGRRPRRPVVRRRALSTGAGHSR